jgi:transcriptional regulator of heat shock response
MKERTQLILDYAIKDFIETGKPVSSFTLYKKYNFNIKSAMIRWELKSLTDQGYFYKCYTSGGRIPTDKAYRYFVDKFLKDNFHKQIIRLKKIDLEKTLDEIVRNLKNLTFFYHLNYNKVYQKGLRYFVNYLEADFKNDLKSVFVDLDYLPQRIHYY